MVVAMKAIGNRINIAEGVSIFTMMAIFTRVNGKTITQLGMAHFSILMEAYSKVTGRII
jgi:hypothetical protein